MRELIIAIMIITVAAPAHADKASRANNKGLETYKNGEYEESVQNFTEALVERPESPILRFNRGTALAAQKNHKEAVNELLSAAKSMETPEGSAAALYNAANSLSASNSLEDAVTLYKQGVKQDQKSEDIRYNLEQVMRKMRDKDQQEQEQQKQDQQDQQKEDQDSQNKDQNDQQDEKDKKEQDKKQQDQNNKTDQQNKDQQQDQQQQESQQELSENQPMSPEEAKRLLDALNDEEKKSLSMRYQKMRRDMRQGDDW